MTTPVETLPSIARMNPGDHYCGIFGSDEDQRILVVNFIRDAITKGEKVLYIVNVQSVQQFKDKLSDAGIDVEPLVAKGQLRILTASEAYLKDGEFDPDTMVELLQEETDQALAEGYPALRATGEMTWALNGDPGSERLVEYEAKLTHKFPAKCYGMCQYDRRRFDSEMLLDVLHTHKHVLVGREGFDNSNMYFIPTSSFLQADRQTAILDRWLHNLASSAPSSAPAG